MKVRKGSFTIEAACVMSLVLITVMGVLYLSFFVHNRSWLTAAAYEAALAGSIEGVQKNGQIYEAASAKAQELGITVLTEAELFVLLGISAENGE